MPVARVGFWLWLGLVAGWLVVLLSVTMTSFVGEIDEPALETAGVPVDQPRVKPTTPRTPPLRVWLMRHAEAQHNADRSNGWAIPDPVLTEQGQQQARDAAARLQLLLASRHIDDIPSLVVSSPLRRALQSAALAAPSVKHVIAHPDLQELGSVPCDTGSPRDVLAQEFPLVDMHLLSSTWHETPDDPSLTLVQRLHVFSSWLVQYQLQDVLVVAHDKLLQQLVGFKFANAEIRGYYLDPVAYTWTPMQ